MKHPRNEKSVTLGRRAFLRGAGVELALPWFETFEAGGLTKDETPKRFVSI